MGNFVINRYLIGEFLKTFLNVVLIFCCLGLIMNLFEEINYFKNYDVGITLPIILSFMIIPSILINMLPFVIFLSSVWVIVKLKNNRDILSLKTFGFSNFRFLLLFSLTSFLVGVLTLIAINPVTSLVVKYYEDLKGKYEIDKSHLASITANGIWIKDEINSNINLINAQKIDGNYLLEVNITQLNKKFDFSKIIHAEKVDISSNSWKLINATSKENNFDYNFEKKMDFESNFDIDKINTLFDNLSSLTFLQLSDLEKEYTNLGYSTLELKLHNQRIMSYPFFITIMTLFSGIIMLNIKFNRSKIFYLIIGILSSVSIYYVNYFSGILGQNEKIPVSLSIWMPIFIFGLFSSIGMVKINEK